MEEQEFSDKVDHPETLITPPLPPPTINDNVHDAAGSAARNSPETEAQRPALSHRLTEAFREGVASARPDYGQRPDAGTAPRAKMNRPESSGAGMLDRVIKEGGAAAAGMGDKAADVLGGVVQLVKKAPTLTQKYAEAFRAGAASVQSRGGKERREEGAPAARGKGASLDGRAILDRVFKAGESAVGFVREAVSVVKPGEVIGARQKIRLGQKKINQLYIDIGGEAANSWSDGLVETEKLAALLDELRQSEEEILTMQAAQQAEVATAGKTTAAKRRQTTKKGTAVAAATDQEDSRVDAGDSGAALYEPVEQPLIDDLEEVSPEPENRVDAGDLGATSDEPVEQPLIDDLGEVSPEPENHVDVTPEPDATPEVGNLSVFVAPESYAVPEQIDAETAQPEESGSEAEPALLEDPDLKQEKKSGAKKDKKGRGNDG